MYELMTLTITDETFYVGTCFIKAIFIRILREELVGNDIRQLQNEFKMASSHFRNDF